MEIWDTDSQHSCICSCVPKEGDLCRGLLPAGRRAVLQLVRLQKAVSLQASQ